MTQQEIFDKVARHLLTQKVRSEGCVNSYPGAYQCRYRQGDLKCAIGCLIPDELYSEKLEGMRVAALPKEVLDVIWPFDKTDYPFFLGLLQMIHDRMDPSEWFGELEALARDVELSSEVLKEFRQ